MIEEIKVGVLITCYNSEKTLKRCLDSLKNQTFKDFKAIIVDDASSDNSVKIIEEYKQTDSRFRLVKHERNQGVARARNTGLSYLAYKYTAFLDSDDYIEPDMLENFVKKAEELDADVVQCRFIYDFESGKRVLPKGAFNFDTYLEGEDLKKVYTRMMTGINMNHVCMKLIRTSLIYNMEFNSELKTAEDLDFCVRMFKKVKKYYFLNEVYYHYVRNDNSLTGKGLGFSEKLKANRYVSKVIGEALSDWGIDTPFYRLLAWSRPYIITVSKIFRMIREKVLK